MADTFLGSFYVLPFHAPNPANTLNGTNAKTPPHDLRGRFTVVL